jgi:hypothetical protein
LQGREGIGAGDAGRCHSIVETGLGLDELDVVIALVLAAPCLLLPFADFKRCRSS